MMTAQLSESVPVLKPSGWAAFDGQLALCRMVLYHRVPAAGLLAGGSIDEVEPPAFQAWMKEVIRGCHAVCG